MKRKRRISGHQIKLKLPTLFKHLQMDEWEWDFDVTDLIEVKVHDDYPWEITIEADEKEINKQLGEIFLEVFIRFWNENLILDLRKRGIEVGVMYSGHHGLVKWEDLLCSYDAKSYLEFADTFDSLAFKCRKLSEEAPKEETE